MGHMGILIFIWAGTCHIIFHRGFMVWAATSGAWAPTFLCPHNVCSSVSLIAVLMGVRCSTQLFDLYFPNEMQCQTWLHCWLTFAHFLEGACIFEFFDCLEFSSFGDGNLQFSFYSQGLASLLPCSCGVSTHCPVANARRLAGT